MLSHHQRVFLQRRIMELEHALFFNFSRAVLKLPTSIIKAIHIDHFGQLWFMVKRPQQRLNEFEKDFPARLEFFRKGKNFHLHVIGKAYIVTDRQELNCAYNFCDEVVKYASPDLMLVKMKITATHYYPHRVKPTKVLHIAPFPNFRPLAFVKTLQYIVKDIIPVFQAH